MKYALGLLFTLFISSTLFAQKEVKLEDLDKYVGDSVIVTGKVFGGRYFPNGEGAPTLLNIGAAYPNQLLTAVIFGEARKEFSGAPEKDYLDQEVRISGKVQLYKGKPQLQIYSPKQITIAGKEKEE